MFAAPVNPYERRIVGYEPAPSNFIRRDLPRQQRHIEALHVTDAFEHNIAYANSRVPARNLATPVDETNLTLEEAMLKCRRTMRVFDRKVKRRSVPSH